MTREEAIKFGKTILLVADSNDDDSAIEFARIAISALEQEPCDDAISREAVIKLAYDMSEIDGEHFDKPCMVVDVEDIQKLPSVTRQTGEWITDARTYYEELNKRGLGVDEYTPYFTDDIACSACLAKYNTIDNETEFFKFCPNCGAKMVEPQESEG